jgi:hypothetical protein
MKIALTFLLCLLAVLVIGQKKYDLKPDAQGYLIIRGTYKPGDTIQLNGYFKAVAVYDLSGAAGKPITITNVPGQTLIIGDSAWSGGAWPHGLAIRNSRYLHIYGTTRHNFKLIGSNSIAKDGNGYPVKAAYFNLIIGELSDNVTAHDITIRHGGTGVWAKTEVSASNPNTWFPRRYLDNFEFYNFDIYNTTNEAFYIGHTATRWNIKTNQPMYTATTDTVTYKQPVKLRNVKVRHNYIHDVATDGIQTAAIDSLLIHDNIISNWATAKDWNHNGGILIGGRVNNFAVHDNRVLNGWGEFMQIYADAGPAIVRNNLFVNNKLSGIGLRGGPGLVVQFLNNTIIQSGESAFRINGASGGTGKNIIKKNIIAQPGTGRYYYLENGGAMSDEDNKTFATLAEAKLNPLLYYQPLVTSSAIGYGYNAGTVVEPPPPPPTETKLSVSITLPTLTLPEGSHVLKLTTPDGKVSDVKIVVQREQ